jgi:hypothetical protein
VHTVQTQNSSLRTCGVIRLLRNYSGLMSLSTCTKAGYYAELKAKSQTSSTKFAYPSPGPTGASAGVARRAGCP